MGIVFFNLKPKLSTILAAIPKSKPILFAFYATISSLIHKDPVLAGSDVSISERKGPMCSYKSHHRLVGRLATDVEGPDTPGIISHRLRLSDLWDGLQSQEGVGGGCSLIGHWFNLYISEGEKTFKVVFKGESLDSHIELIPKFLLLDPYRLSYWWTLDPLEVKFISPQGEEGIEAFGRLMKRAWGHPNDDYFKSSAPMAVRVASEYEPPEVEGCLGAVGYCDDLQAEQLRQSARSEEAIILAGWGSAAARSARYPLVDRSFLDPNEYDDGSGEPRPDR